MNDKTINDIQRLGTTTHTLTSAITIENNHKNNNGNLKIFRQFQGGPQGRQG